MVVDLLGAAHLFDLPQIHHHDGVGHVHRLGLVVGDVDGGNAEFLLDPAKLHLHRLAQLEVERSQGFIHQHHPGRIGHCTGHGDPLLLPAADLGGVPVVHFRQLDQVEELANPLADLVLGVSPFLQAEADVVADGEVGKKGVVLEHHADFAVLGRHPCDVLVAEQDRARGRRQEPRDQPQGSGLAAARGTKEGEEFTLLDLEVQRLEGSKVPEFLDNPGKENAGHDGSVSSVPSRSYCATERFH